MCIRDSAKEVDLNAAVDAPKRRRRRSPNRGKKVETQRLVKPIAPGQARAAIALPDRPTLGGEDYGRWIEEQKREALMLR
eukprot:9306987-Pyramimonas_sp.AAC.1